MFHGEYLSMPFYMYLCDMTRQPDGVAQTLWLASGIHLLCAAILPSPEHRALPVPHTSRVHGSHSYGVLSGGWDVVHGAPSGALHTMCHSTKLATGMQHFIHSVDICKEWLFVLSFSYKCSLQDIYRHAYQFLGKLLFLTHEFPEPKNLFSGAVWTAFYMLSVHQGEFHLGGILRSFRKTLPWIHFYMSILTFDLLSLLCT